MSLPPRGRDGRYYCGSIFLQNCLHECEGSVWSKCMVIATWRVEGMIPFFHFPSIHFSVRTYLIVRTYVRFCSSQSRR